MSEYGDKAEALFCQGYNCAQSVICAFNNLTGLEQDTAAKLGSSFGGGLGRMREVCGAVSGAAMVLGILRGYTAPEDSQAKRDHYHLVQALANTFRERNGSIVCRELLDGISVIKGRDPEARTAEYYRKRPCPDLVREAAEITAQLLGKTVQ